jgi:hypothetical protein
LVPGLSEPLPIKILMCATISALTLIERRTNASSPSNPLPSYAAMASLEQLV